jgi:hypothetical protein
MKRLLIVGSLLVTAVAATTAASSLSPQGASALSAFLTAAIERGDVPGVVVAVVNKDGVLCACCSTAAGSVTRASCASRR